MQTAAQNEMAFQESPGLPEKLESFGVCHGAESNDKPGRKTIFYGFTPEQLANLTAIVWLYRGQSDRFHALVQQHLERTLKEAAAIAGKAAALRQSYDALVDAAAPFLKTLLSNPRSSRGNEALTEKDQSLLTSAATIAKERDDVAKACFDALDELTARIAKEWKKPCEPKLAAQKKLLSGLEELATARRDLVKDIDLVFKLAARVVDVLGTQRERLLSPALSSIGWRRGSDLRRARPAAAAF